MCDNGVAGGLYGCFLWRESLCSSYLFCSCTNKEGLDSRGNKLQAKIKLDGGKNQLVHLNM